MAKSDTTVSELTSEMDDVPADQPAGKKKLVIILAAVGVLLIGGGGAFFMTGMAGSLFGSKPHAAPINEIGSIDLPDIVANLNAGNRRTAFVKLKVRLELANKTDETVVKAGQDKMLDLFQTYLRDMRPEELRGAVGTYRLREELMARANIALAPAHVTQILFLEMLIQ
jgi:flagellar FliL protein